MLKPVKPHRSSIFRSIGLLIALIASNAALALTTLTVTVSSDNNPGGIGEIGDLRYCLNSMNLGLNTIPDDYAIVFAFPMTIQLNGNLPLINNSPNPVNVTIGNPGPVPTVTIDGNSGAYSGFFIPMGNVTIQNMTFQNLTARGGNGGDGISGGGGGLGAGGAISRTAELFEWFESFGHAGECRDQQFLRRRWQWKATSASRRPARRVAAEAAASVAMAVRYSRREAREAVAAEGSAGTVEVSRFRPTCSAAEAAEAAAWDHAPPWRAHESWQWRLRPGRRTGWQRLWLVIIAGSGGGGMSGGNNAGGGGGGGPIGGMLLAGGGGGGSTGSDGIQPQGAIPPMAKSTRATHREVGGALRRRWRRWRGGGGGAVVTTFISNEVDGKAANGGYGGGGGGGAGSGAYDVEYTVEGGTGGLGGGGGGGGVNLSGITSANGGHSLGGGGGGGGGPSSGVNAPGGSDIGNLGGGSGGFGADTYGSGFGGGGGGGGSGLGGAIFVDSNLNFTLQALAGMPTTSIPRTTRRRQAFMAPVAPVARTAPMGRHWGNSIFLRTGASLTLRALDAGDLLTLGDQVAFTDDTVFGAGGTSVFVTGNGTVVYNGTTDYQGSIQVTNATFQVNGIVDEAPVVVDRNIAFSMQKGTLGGTGTLTGNVFVDAGIVCYPSAGSTLTLGSLNLASPSASAVHIDDRFLRYIARRGKRCGGVGRHAGNPARSGGERGRLLHAAHVVRHHRHLRRRHVHWRDAGELFDLVSAGGCADVCPVRYPRVGGHGGDRELPVDGGGREHGERHVHLHQQRTESRRCGDVRGQRIAGRRDGELRADRAHGVAAAERQRRCLYGELHGARIGRGERHRDGRHTTADPNGANNTALSTISVSASADMSATRVPCDGHAGLDRQRHVYVHQQRPECRRCGDVLDQRIAGWCDGELRADRADRFAAGERQRHCLHGELHRGAIGHGERHRHGRQHDGGSERCEQHLAIDDQRIRGCGHDGNVLRSRRAAPGSIVRRHVPRAPTTGRVLRSPRRAPSLASRPARP